MIASEVALLLLLPGAPSGRAPAASSTRDLPLWLCGFLLFRCFEFPRAFGLLSKSFNNGLELQRRTFLLNSVLSESASRLPRSFPCKQVSLERLQATSSTHAIATTKTAHVASVLQSTPSTLQPCDAGGGGGGHVQDRGSGAGSGGGAGTNGGVAITKLLAQCAVMALPRPGRQASQSDQSADADWDDFGTHAKRLPHTDRFVRSFRSCVLRKR